jgi:hypothetical protein
VPPKETTLVGLLEKYKTYAALTLLCDDFDASKVDGIPRRKLVVEAVELTSSPQPLPIAVAKMIFRPEVTEGFLWPPYECLFKEDVAILDLNSSEMHVNRYVNRYRDGYLSTAKNRDRLYVDNRLIPERQLKAFLQAGYEIEDQERSIQRFLPALRNRMGYP